MLQAFLHRSTFQVAPIPHHEATAVAAPHHAPQAHADRTGAEDGKTLRFHAENLQNFMSSLVQWHRKIDKTSEAQGLVLRPFVWRNWVQTTQGVLCVDLHCPLEKRATRVLWPVRHGYIFLSWVVKSDPHCISSTFSAPVFWPSWRQMLDMSLSFSNCACAIQSCWGSSNAVGLFRWTEHRFHKFEPQVDRFWSSHLVGKKCWLYPASATRFRKNRSFKPAVNCRSRDCPAEKFWATDGNCAMAPALHTMGSKSWWESERKSESLAPRHNGPQRAGSWWTRHGDLSRATSTSCTSCTFMFVFTFVGISSKTQICSEINIYHIYHFISLGSMSPCPPIWIPYIIYIVIITILDHWTSCTPLKSPEEPKRFGPLDRMHCSVAQLGDSLKGQLRLWENVHCCLDHTYIHTEINRLQFAWMVETMVSWQFPLNQPGGKSVGENSSSFEEMI